MGIKALVSKFLFISILNFCNGFVNFRAKLLAPVRPLNPLRIERCSTDFQMIANKRPGNMQAVEVLSAAVGSGNDVNSLKETHADIAGVHILGGGCHAFPWSNYLWIRGVNIRKGLNRRLGSRRGYPLVGACAAQVSRTGAMIAGAQAVGVEVRPGKLLEMVSKGTSLSDSFLVAYDGLRQVKRRTIDSAISTIAFSLSQFKTFKMSLPIESVSVGGSDSPSKLLSTRTSGSADDIDHLLSKRNFTEFYGENGHCKYSSNSTRGGHIVSEYFQYIDREDENKELVYWMRYRQKDRRDPPSYDKISNPLIAIPGSPGSGKSSFLVHFPESAAYREYAGDAIVSTLSFNGGMAVGSEGDRIGLRVIYGAFKGMGLLPATYRWDNFVEQFGHELPVHSGEISTAVEVLRKVFGRDRRILILMDELSQSQDTEDIFLELGMILSKKGDVDVVVSSPSPKVTVEFHHRSQRPINYVVLQNMIKYDLGRAECREWADMLILESKCDNLPESKKNLLYNAYLLYSGHPGSLVRMCGFFADVERWEKVYRGFAKKLASTKAIDILQNDLIGGNILPFREGLADLTAQDLRRYILSARHTVYDGDPTFHRFVDNGSLTIVKRVGESTFQTSTQAIAFYRFVLSEDLGPEILSGTQVASAISLFADIGSISVLWARIVCLNIINDLYGSFDYSEAFGIMYSILPDLQDLSRLGPLRIEKEGTSGSDSGDKEAALILPTMHDSIEFDAILKMLELYTNKPHYFYLRMKLKKKKNNTLFSEKDRNSTDAIAAIIRSCIKDYQIRTGNLGRLSELHICVYLFDEDIGTGAWQEQQEDSDAFASEDLRSRLKDSPLALRYVDEHFGNFHVIGEENFEKFMNPTLLPLAQMVRNIGGDDDEE